MEGRSFSHSRDYLDRFIRSQDSSAVNKFQQTYWRTKQTLIKVTGKKEDEHVVASDAELDAKLEVFHSIQRTSLELLKVIELYQRRICSLSQEENELGRFLRSQCSQDKTRAGKIMQATGKALCFSSQQRLALRKPLCRLYQEIETFRYRAISDTWLTVNRMEQSRTEYRGALLWMKDVSQELDPDTHKQMEKFRKVQAQVRTTKTSFDQLRNDVCQKVDLLGASRCNLLSHVLTTYQTTLLHFWEKTSHTMAAISESFKGCQNYELSTLKVRERFYQEIQLLKDRKSRLLLQMLHDATDKPAEKEKKKTKEETGEEKRDESAGEQIISLGNETTNNKTREGGEEDSMALLAEILGDLFVDQGDSSQNWTEGSGQTDAQLKEKSFFLPSQLLDQSLKRSSVSDQSGVFSPALVGAAEPSPGPEQNPQNPALKEPGAPKDLSAWFHLFADLDPLSNPDAIGEASREHELHTA